MIAWRWRGWMGVLAIMIALGGGAVREARADGAADWAHERWYVVQMEGAKVGWLRHQRSVNDEGHLVSEEEFHLALARMGMDVVRMEMRSRFVETIDARPIEIGSFMDLGGGATETLYRFSDDGRRVTETTRRADARPRTREIARPPGRWLTPGEVARFVRARLDAGAETIAYATIDASSGLQVVMVRASVLERTFVEALGKRVPAIRWEATTSLMPGITMTAYVDDRGNDIRSSLNLGGIVMDMIATEREVALSPFEAPEMMASTLVAPEGDIPEPRSARRSSMVLRLTGDDERQEMPGLLTAGGQRAERLGPRAVRITIDLDAPVLLREDERGAWFDPRYLGSSMMIDLDDALLHETLASALRDIEPGADEALKAEAIRRFVYRFIDNKSLGVGFASASETCRTREGDCTEHAALLTALLRLAGIPSRAVSGLVFVDQFAGAERVFGFHMWSQALLRAGEDEAGRPLWAWTDLDAAISPRHPTDAARIAVVGSTLGDDDLINSMVDVALLMGQLSIEIEPVEAGAAR